MKLQIFMWFITALSIVGTILNVYKKWICYLFWISTNIVWIVYDIYIDNLPQAVMMLVYLFLAVWGLKKWIEDDRNAKKSGEGDKEL